MILICFINTLIYVQYTKFYLPENISITIYCLNCIVPPEIPVPPVDTTVVDGDEAVFNCTVVGEPLPTISWYISGVNLSINTTTPFNQEGRINDDLSSTTVLNITTLMSTLTLNETIPFLAEDFVCVASNDLGSINRTATLTVLGEL